MYFPKFWARARKGGVCAWGWSDVSPSEAHAAGASRVDRIIDRLTNDEHHEKWTVNRYGYPDRPMREEVIHQFGEPAGAAVVTRNSYGCLVLNTNNALFVDVDEPAEPIFSSFTSLFRKKPVLEDLIMEKVRKWVRDHPDWNWRVYRTKAGFRLLATHRPISPGEPLAEEAFEAFKADILYRKLCVNQKCFRARLTPKSWRCGVDRISNRWPWFAPEDEAVFREWEKTCLAAAAEYATCRLLGQEGNGVIHPHLSVLVDFHDKATGVGSARPLA